MPYKRDNSPFYQVRRRNLVGVGDTGVLTTRTKNKALARRMETALVEVAERALVEPSYRAVVDAVVSKRLPLPELLSAVTRGDVAELRTEMVDPPLADCGARYVERAPEGGRRDRRRYAVDDILAVAPPRARLSWLRDPRHVASLLHAVQRGEPLNGDGELTPRKRNSVRRHHLLAVSTILRAEVSAAERDRVIGEVSFPAEDDTREVALSPDDVGRLLAACRTWQAKPKCDGYRDLELGIRIMLQTSADRGMLFAGPTANRLRPAPGLTVSQVRIYAEGPRGGETYSGELYLADTKAAARRRTVPITDALCRELLPQIGDKRADEQLLGLAYSQVDVRWQNVRRTAELPGLRLKDLRAQTAIYAERAQVPLTIAQKVLGHGDASMTRRYQRHEAAMTQAHAAAIEREMGLAS